MIEEAVSEGFVVVLFSYRMEKLEVGTYVTSVKKSLLVPG